MRMSEYGSHKVWCICWCCACYLQLINKRPLSPDVFELNSMQPHYKMPWGALSSIMNRATGAALSAGAITYMPCSENVQQQLQAGEAVCLHTFRLTSLCNLC